MPGLERAGFRHASMYEKLKEERVRSLRSLGQDAIIGMYFKVKQPLNASMGAWMQPFKIHDIGDEEPDGSEAIILKSGSLNKVYIGLAFDGFWNGRVQGNTSHRILVHDKRGVHYEIRNGFVPQIDPVLPSPDNTDIALSVPVDTDRLVLA